jgi:3-mercaptopyruvate sulfurtransferase SseA
MGDGGTASGDRFVTPEPTNYQAAEPDLSSRAFLTDVLPIAARRADATQLIDVRSPAEFSGEIMAPLGHAETAQRRGHVPGAHNIPWAQPTNQDGTFKDFDALQGHCQLDYSVGAGWVRSAQVPGLGVR